ncbi:MAG: hypothetical protein E7390_07605 [Ruminococcaceae bacterium]|nr:hypothetical protein [Oscillospiraceae bacterium]
MQHKLTVAGSLPRKSIPSVRGVEVKNETDSVTFTAASEEDMQRLKRLLALQLADMITREYEEKSLSSYIDAAHPYFLPGERQHILHSARLAVQKQSPAKRAHYIENRLYSFLEESEVLSLEGFLNFRLKEYKELLKNAALTAVDVYLAEREYDEFITLLRYFVNTQPAGEPVLHVVTEENGRFRLLNRAGEDVRALCEEAARTGDAAGLTEEDILLSTLITVAPRTITFHRAQWLQNVQLLETVMKVFPGRVHICENCPLCEKNVEFEKKQN